MASKLNVFSIGFMVFCGAFASTSTYKIMKDRLPKGELPSFQAQKEAQEEIPSLLRIATLIQQHRGMSQGAIAGNEKNKAALPEKEKEIADAFKKVVTSGGKAKVIDKNRVSDFEAEFTKLTSTKEGLTMAPRENFQKHTVLVNGLNAMITEAGDKVGWLSEEFQKTTLVFDLTSRSVIESMESVAQVRGIGNRLLRSENASEVADRDLLAPAVVKLQKSMVVMEKYKMQVADMTPARSQLIRDFVDKYEKRVAEVTKVVNNNLMSVQKRGVAPKADDFFAYTTETIGMGETAVKDIFLPMLKDVADKEYEETSQNRMFNIGLVYGSTLLAGLLLGFAGFLFGVYLNGKEKNY